MIISRRILPAIFWIAMAGCTPIEYADFKGPAQGFRPVYQSADNLPIRWDDPRTLKAPGKIYVYGNQLFVNEVGLGIHVFDNSDPSTPTAIGFINVPGNTDLAIQNGILYSNYLNKIVSVRLNQYSDLEKLEEVVFSNSALGVSPPANHYFECVDPDKGLVIHWLPVEITNPECYAI
ncbi:MAG TPA: hypothetical protein VD927_08245 [Chryseosolibacter sp.]|nr:hypothetical protein [Chryseosolibacter sp.]